MFIKLSLTIILFFKLQNKFISIKLKLYFLDNPSKYELVFKIRLISSFFDKLSKPRGTWGTLIKKNSLSLKIVKKSVIWQEKRQYYSTHNNLSLLMGDIFYGDYT